MSQLRKGKQAMSHFTVLVIGGDVEKQLAPYHEFECTGIDDEFVRDVDQTADVQSQIDEDGLAKRLEWFGLDDSVVSSEAEVDLASKHKYGYAVVRDGKLIKAIKRTNPDKTWDWWVVGGRWKGMFLLKDGSRADDCTWGEVDFKGMRDEAEQKVRQRYADAHRLIGDAPRPETWDAIGARHVVDGNTDWDKARHVWREQPAIARLLASRDGGFGFLSAPEVDAFFEPVERAVEQARRGALAPFALVKDGKWYARGRMGWWASVHDEKDTAEWERQVDALLEGLPPETRLTLVDCHI